LDVSDRSENRMDESPTPHVHFSRAQKLDLFRMTAAALVSTGFLAAPVMLSERGASALPAAEAKTAPRIELVTTEVVATVTTPELQRPAPRVVRAASTPRPRPHFQRASTRTTPRLFTRKVARLIAGDGRYSVRPFPTVQLAER
jgi:hypothetical protein